MSIEAMKQALEALKRLNDIDGMYSWADTEQALRQAIEQAEKQQALDKKADNARELGLDYEPVAWNENVDEMPFNIYCKAIVDWYSYATDGDSFLEGRDVEVIVVRYKVDEDEDDIVFIHKGNKQYAHTKCEVSKWKPLYTAPPRKEWVGLTDEERLELIAYQPHPLADRKAIINAVERLLKEKNT